MTSTNPYRPVNIFAVEDDANKNVPRVLIAPNRYIQGDGVIDDLGRYLTIVPSKRSAILLSEGGQKRLGSRLLDSLRDNQIDPFLVTFNGECSIQEVERVVSILKNQTAPIDCVVAVGGGKCVDAGKSIAYRLGIPSVVCPSLASNDAPCSALSVMYSPEGAMESVEFFPNSPSLVVVDTRIVAEAPVRYLVAGMGDAMATWYEARTCFQNPDARSTVGARPTLAAGAIGELCAMTLFEYGVGSIDAVQGSIVNDALERVVEANTLLSGVGFESGGLAGAHAVAQAFTVISEVQSTYLHGEMVGLGLLTQLMLEDQKDEAKRVAEFFTDVGLPVRFGHLGMSMDSREQIMKVMDTAINAPSMRNEPMEVTRELLHRAASEVENLGVRITQSIGDAAYDNLHNRL